MTINDYLKKTEAYIGAGWYKSKVPSPVIVCADGFKISIQGSVNHYCEPRENNGPYTQVECGYPSGPVSVAMQEYADNPTTLDTVYAYVPTEVAEAELQLHGGIV